jgi:ribonuclease D
MIFPPSITKEELDDLPLETFPGSIVVVDRPEQVREALAYLCRQNAVGFDTETRPNFTKNDHHKVSLIQISTEKVCYLFRLKRLGAGFPSLIKAFLENRNVMKIGLSLLDDFHSLRKLTALDPAGFVDLQQFVLPFGIQEAGLRKIYAILFQKKISKRAQLSNWEAATLTEPMQQYAALDAWACLRIYQFLILQQ